MGSLHKIIIDLNPSLITSTSVGKRDLEAKSIKTLYKSNRFKSSGEIIWKLKLQTRQCFSKDSSKDIKNRQTQPWISKTKNWIHPSHLNKIQAFFSDTLWIEKKEHRWCWSQFSFFFVLLRYLKLGKGSCFVYQTPSLAFFFFLFEKCRSSDRSFEKQYLLFSPTNILYLSASPGDAFRIDFIIHTAWFLMRVFCGRLEMVTLWWAPSNMPAWFSATKNSCTAEVVPVPGLWQADASVFPFPHTTLVSQIKIILSIFEHWKI